MRNKKATEDETEEGEVSEDKCDHGHRYNWIGGWVIDAAKKDASMDVARWEDF